MRLARPTQVPVSAVVAPRRDVVATVGGIHGDPGQFSLGRGPDLPYGQRLKFGDYQCRVDQIGLFLESGLYELVTAQPRRKLDPRRVGRLTAELAENAYEVLAISYLIADREVVRLLVQSVPKPQRG